MSSSDCTSAGSTNVEPIEVASGRTRFSMRLSTDEKPTSAPSSWSARAIPQAVVRTLPGRDHQLNNDLRQVATIIAALSTDDTTTA